MKQLKRILFWVLLVAFVIACLFWFVHVPYRPERLYRLLPENTTFVSHHRLLADRWDDFVNNLVAQTLLGSAGLEVEDLLDWSDDPQIRPWLDKLLARDVIIAHIPQLGPTREPAWMMAGWIGGESVRLRWLLQRGLFPDLQAEPRQGGGGYWRLEPLEDTSEHLAIAVVEGMLVGVFSADPHAIRHVLDVYDGLAPSYQDWHGDSTMARPCQADVDSLDQGWFMGLDLDGRRVRYRFDLNHIDPNGLGGSVCTAAAGDWPRIGVVDLEPAGRLLGDIPFLTIGAQPDALYTVMQGRLPPVGDQILQGLYETGPEGLVMASIQGGRDYAGSFFGISIPSILLMWPVADETAAIDAIQQLLDQLNARWRWGLIASPRPGQRYPVYIIESTSGTPYARFRERERLAFALVDGWLVLASHARPLNRLLERWDQPASLIESSDGGWQPGIRQADAALHGYWDIAAGAPTLRMAIAAYSMRLLFEDRAGSRETRQQLAAAREWLDLLEAVGAARVWLDQRDGTSMIRFHIGEYEETP